MSESFSSRPDFTGLQATTKEGTYTWIRFIGAGAYGHVWMAKRTKGNESKEFAIKCISQVPEDSKDTSLNQIAEIEFDANTKIKQAKSDKRKEHIMTFEEKFEYKPPNGKFNLCCLVFKLAEGGNLYSRMLEFNYSEKDVAKIMRGILHGLDFIHNVMQFVHFDLKPENIVFYKRDSYNPVIGDFNPIYLEGDGKLHRCVNHGLHPHTDLYAAPELREDGAVSKKCDMFSLGMICVEFLLGFHPFEVTEDHGTTDKTIAQRDVDFSRFDGWKSITQQGQEFVNKLTCKDPELRLSVTEALNHEWFNFIKLKTSCRAPPSFREPLDRRLRKPHRKLEFYRVGFKKNPATGKLQVVMVKFEGLNFKGKSKGKSDPRSRPLSLQRQDEENAGDTRNATNTKKDGPVSKTTRTLVPSQRRKRK